MAKIELTTEELETHLEEQLELLEASCQGYDDGRKAEAKRIALHVRVLCHETKNSRSLLGQLGKRTGDFQSTCLPFDGANVLSHSGLIQIDMHPNGSKFRPLYDEGPFSRWTQFDDWWGEVVFHACGQKLTRSQLVLIAANQDGGAHVDSALDDVYHAFAKRNALQWLMGSEGHWTAMEGPEGAALRQIGHEVLCSLRPTYKVIVTKKERPSLSIMGASLIESMHFQPVPPTDKKQGRNEMCSCGSGKKYKRCHGQYT